MTRAVSVGRSKGFYAAGALGFTLLTLSLVGCPGTLDPSAFPSPTSGTAGTTGSGGVPSGTGGTPGGTAGTTGTGGTTGTAGAAGCDITPILIGDNSPGKCTQSGCHDATGASANFSMVGDWQTHLVDTPPKGGGSVFQSACFKDAAFKTVPYIMKNSQTGDGLFLQKIKAPACMGGLQMPFGFPALSPDQIACVQKWAAALATK
jgi:hypothetical protein